ncbi:MAG: DUF1349 domain-containing protein [Chloroflexota bacterium]|nr:DUF1349 domain-containing protein [Chloroflexota bacterium]
MHTNRKRIDGDNRSRNRFKAKVLLRLQGQQRSHLPEIKPGEPIHLLCPDQVAARNLFDQCGIALCQDSENWFKCGVEYDTPAFSRLGSVVTNLGYSDWATTNVESSFTDVFYRLSKRGQDYLIEFSEDGAAYHPMRIFHMHHPSETVRLGVLACSPTKSPFTAQLS